MEKIKIKINNKVYNVFAARDEEEREQGLQNVNRLEDNEGCLFFYSSPENVSYWMKNTSIPLDIIFIDDDKEVISVKEGIPNTEDYISENKVKYVLELNRNSGIETGDILKISKNDDFSEDEELDLDPNKLYIIGSDGKPQAELFGGERIFSRVSTATILRKAKRAYDSGKDGDYKSLGKYVFNEMDAQDSRKPEFVNKPNNQ